MKVWILTSEVNEYDQFGEYFEAAFQKFPTREQLKAHIQEPEIVDYLLNGNSGRQSDERWWYNLRKVELE